MRFETEEHSHSNDGRKTQGEGPGVRVFTEVRPLLFQHPEGVNKGKTVPRQGTSNNRSQVLVNRGYNSGQKIKKYCLLEQTIVNE